MIGRPISLLLPPDRIDEEAMILERLRRGERLRHFETVRVRKDGGAIAVALTISPILDASGAIIGASKIMRDITAEQTQPVAHPGASVGARACGAAVHHGADGVRHRA